jgi:hypothetical protein
MPRDHLLGYRPLVADHNYVEPFPLGIPSRVIRETQQRLDRQDREMLPLVDFETGDHQSDGLVVKEQPAPVKRRVFIDPRPAKKAPTPQADPAPDGITLRMLRDRIVSVISSREWGTPEYVSAKTTVRSILFGYGAKGIGGLKPEQYAEFLKCMDLHGL